MKKFIIWILIWISFFNSSYAINGDDIISHTSVILAWQESEDIIDIWYDWVITTLYITCDLSAEIEIYDGTHLVFHGILADWVVFNEQFVVRDTFKIVNADNKDISFYHSWYRFIEWTDISLNWISSDTLINDNGSLKQEYEFLRQNELFSFYEMELTALLLLTILVILWKYSFSNKSISFK